MICPDGYFTPKKMEWEYRRVLSNDRLAPSIFQTAGASFDGIPLRDREPVLDVSALLFTHLFLRRIETSARLFCPTRHAPLKVDAWLFRANCKLPTELPTTRAQTRETNAKLTNRLLHLCIETWTVDSGWQETCCGPLTKSEKMCLVKTEGWSLCFEETDLPPDFGSSLSSLAIEMAQSAGTSKRRRRGPKSKVGPLTESIKAFYPHGVPNKATKSVGAELRGQGIDTYSDDTLRKAIERAKEEMKTIT